MSESHETGRLNNVLIICDVGVDHAILSTILENNGFPVTTTESMVTPNDLENYGAIIHIGYSEGLLEARLGDRLEAIKDEEWIFMAGGETQDLHCTVELTNKASDQLGRFMRVLWSQYSIT